MSATVIDGKAIGAEIRADVGARIEKAGVTPGFVDVLVGDDQASATYVRMKYKAAQALGMHVEDRMLPPTASRDELLKVIDELNADPAIHGVIVQSPLPEESDVDIFELQQAILPEKDVDGLHPMNQGLLALGRPRFIPATTAGVVELLHRAGVEVEGAHAVIIGRSTLVTRPLANLLSLKQPGLNATVTICHTGTKDLRAHTREADILVAAMGRGPRITPDLVKPGAAVIDVGTRSGPDGKLIGDVEFDAVAEVAGTITPVPGGVGPMTVAMLLANIATAAGI